MMQKTKMILFLKLSQDVPDVVLTSGDMLALGALNAFKKFGIRRSGFNNRARR